MTVHRKEALLSHHAFMRLRLVHAAFVDSYECHIPKGRMPVNRLLFVCGGDRRAKSMIRDLRDGRLLPMKAGRLYFIPCNHEVDIDIAASLSFVSLQFNLDLFHGVDVMESHPRCETLEDRLLVDEMRLLMEREAELRTAYRVNETVFRLCALWSSHGGAEIAERLARSRKYETALDYIRLSADASTTVEELADMVGMRKDVFSRKFTRDMGVTPKDFMSGALLRKASDMLLAPGVQVNKVAKELNFSSEYYFSHFFKRRTGVSPREFQRQNGGK